MQQEFECPFELIEPHDQAGPLLYCSPHSGNVYPPGFLASSRLGQADLRRSADLYVDELVGDAVRAGVPVLRAHFPRCFVDVNREPYELDPAMFAGRPPVFANTRSPRVAAGYGTIARLVGDQQPIYPARIPIEEALRRIDAYYLPFHACLRRRVQATQSAFGACVLVDWHSMPAAVFPGFARTDIVLGDRHGASCQPALTAALADLFRDLGLVVQCNQPYAGGFITEHYGRPSAGCHAVQIEINRSLYMDEARQVPHAGFDDVRRMIGEVTEALVQFAPQPVRLAAE